MSLWQTVGLEEADAGICGLLLAPWLTVSITPLIKRRAQPAFEQEGRQIELTPCPLFHAPAT